MEEKTGKPEMDKKNMKLRNGQNKNMFTVFDHSGANVGGGRRQTVTMTTKIKNNKQLDSTRQQAERRRPGLEVCVPGSGSGSGSGPDQVGSLRPFEKRHIRTTGRDPGGRILQEANKKRRNPDPDSDLSVSVTNS